MADPVTLATIGIGATAAGAGVGAIGNLFSGNANAAMYNYQAGVAQVNKTLATQDANYALQSGEVEAQKSGMATRAQVGQTRAGFGASNVDVNTGSSNRVLTSETEIGQQNQSVIRANAAKRAYGFNVAAAQDTAQAAMYTSAASTSQTAAGISAASTILGGIGQVSSKWLQAGQYFPGKTGTSSSDYFGNVGGDSSSTYGS